MSGPTRPKAPRLVDVVLYLVGVAATAAAITLLFLGDRAVMDVGGMCAEGGPYVIRQHCPENTALIMFLGFVGTFASPVLVAWKGSKIGGGAGSVAFLAWPGAFGAIGFTSLQYGFDPPGDTPGWDAGWLTMGIVFVAVAFLPLVPLVLGFLAAPVPPGAPAGRSPALPGAVRVRRSRSRSEAPASGTGADAGRLDAALAAGARAVAEAGGAGGSRGEPLVGGLERLAALHDDGALTDEEYARAKDELLAGAAK